MTAFFDDIGECVDAMLRRLGNRIVLAMPLGIGKPNVFANELYRRAARDPALDLTILTALSLRKPQPASALERRFTGPLVERIFGSYVDLDYALAAQADALPANVRVIEFYFQAGASLNSAHSQQNYLSTNYTHVGRDALLRGVNVIAQLVAKRTTAGITQYSFGSNPDVTVDLLPLVEAARRDGRDALMIGQVHAQMPFMLGAAQAETQRFDYIVEHPRYDFDLFCPPNPALGSVDHAIGLHASALVRDGGTLQLGIGELGDSVAYSLLLRHQQNASYIQALADLGIEKSAALIDAEGGRRPFVEGVFGSTEMFVDQMLDLYRAGILRRRVYNWLPLQRLLASGRIRERFAAGILEALRETGLGPRLSEAEFIKLREFGVFREDCRFESGMIVNPEGVALAPDLDDRRAASALAEQCLGRELRGGAVLHAGFFVGPRGFYAALRDLPDRERRQFDMRGIGFINQLYGDDYELRVLQRAQARFINTTMMVTLLGAAVSDTLEDGRVVSGVGGQYNFVAMAHALPDARSILCVRATRSSGGRTSSNLVWNYANTTIPRHLRDVVVTEYGIADLRGRTDAEVIAALLGIADSRFQEGLLAEARRHRKIAADYRIPDARRANLPENLERAFSAHRRAGLFTEYPFGTDLTAEEIALAHALRYLKGRTAKPLDRLATAARAALHRVPRAHEASLRRMHLAAPAALGERFTRRLVSLALSETTP
ncbi:MAG: acetyl-CoA hydrolase/transferase C-terminal domain-containing protein [Steroidobacteraceae bacterium]